MNAFSKLYKEFFGINEAIPAATTADVENTNALAASMEKVVTQAKELKTALTTNEELDEAQLVNHIYDYRGGVEYVLRDPSQAEEVAKQIQQWTEKKGFTIVKHTLSPTGKVGYFYFRLGQDPEREAQRIQGYFSSKLEIKFFRFNVKEQQPQSNTEI